MTFCSSAFNTEKTMMERALSDETLSRDTTGLVIK